MKALRCLIIVALLTTSVWGAPSTSAREEKMRWALSVIMDTMIPKVEEWPIDSKSFEDSARNVRDKDTSLGESREKTRQDLMSRFEKEAARQCDKLKADKAWRDKALESIRTRAKSAVEKNLAGNMAKAFAPVRKGFIDDERKKLYLNVHPNPQEVEDYITSENSTDLKARLTERFKRMQSRPVYSENENWFKNTKVPDILREAKNQHSSQTSLLKLAKLGIDEKTPSDIITGIRSKFQEQRKKIEEQGRYAYPVFPSIEKRLPEKAKELAVSKFLDVISVMSFPVSEEEVAEVIRRDGLKKHLEYSESKTICENVFSEGIEESTFNKYTEGMSHLRKKELDELKKGITSGSYKSVISGLVSRSLSESLDKVRKDIATMQMQEFFRSLAEKTWKPGTEMIEMYDNRSWIDIADPLNIPGVSSGKASNVFQETTSMVKETEKEFIQKGLDALRRQKSIVSDVYDVLDDIKAVEGMSSESDVRYEFTKKVKESYSGFSNDYKELFPKVVKDIEIKSDAIWNNERTRQQATAMAKAKSKSQKSSPASNAGASSNDAGGLGGGIGGDQGGGIGGGTGENQPDVIIDLAYSGGIFKRERVLARIAFVKERKVIEYSLIAEEGANGKALYEIQGLMEAWLKKSGNGDNKVELYIVTRVFHWELFSGIIFDLRECVSTAMGRVNNKNLDVYWLDIRIKGDKKFEEYKGRFNIPFDFRKKSTKM